MQPHASSALEAVLHLAHLRRLSLSLSAGPPSQQLHQEPDPQLVTAAAAACSAARVQRAGEGSQNVPSLTVCVPSEAEMQALAAAWHAQDPTAALTPLDVGRVQLQAWPH